MSFKIVPWLLVLSISLAYAFPAEHDSSEEDPNHVHDEHCTHPIKNAFEKVKTSVSTAYQKTKQTIGNAFNNLKNSFKGNKPETEKKPEGQGTESTDLGVDTSVGSVNPGRNDDSFGGNGNTGGSSDGNSNTGGSFGGNTGSANNGEFPNTGSDDTSGNNSGTSNVGNTGSSNGGSTGGQQKPPSESEVEQLIDVRFRNKPTKKNNL